ncbi:MAG: OmpA family protein [Epsilonproteobacteria bacterium]|nr:OmpA family protein [Campylobacterota bacterium]
MSIILIFSSCTPKNNSDLPQSIPTHQLLITNQELQDIKDEIILNCSAHELADSIKIENNPILVKLQTHYLFVDLNNLHDFKPASYLLTQQAKDKLACIIPILYAHETLYIHITGHTDTSGNPKKNQHLSDNRAITVAEKLYQSNIPHEIFVKGCADKKPRLSAIFGDDASSNRRVEIYIYENKSYLLDHCQ